jgi:glycosyltransferase involved in cell wall biosynthesis
MSANQKNNPLISIIVPAFNEAENLEWHHDEMTRYLEKNSLRYEFLYVNDGSTDGTLDILRSLCKNNSKAHFISFSRNFGKEPATAAGIANAKGDVALIIDADGQHPIELLGKFLKKYKEGYEVVAGVRESNIGEGAIKKYGSKLFYYMLKTISGKDGVPGSTDFRLIDRKVMDAFNDLTERNRVTRNLIDWLGFKRIEIPFNAKERHAGEATYSIRKLFALAINGIISHTTRPLKFIALLGGIISFTSFIALVAMVIEKYILNDPLGLSISGVAILAVFISFSIGVVLICQGLLALYLESVYHEAQNRPLYVISEEA